MDEAYHSPCPDATHVGGVGAVGARVEAERIPVGGPEAPDEPSYLTRTGPSSRGPQNGHVEAGAATEGGRVEREWFGPSWAQQGQMQGHLGQTERGRWPPVPYFD